MGSNTDRIEREILLEAPPAAVWRALTNIREFNNWFRVKLEGDTFEAGRHFRGGVAYPGCEHLVFEVTIVRCDPERLLSWRWHPAAIDAAVDYSGEPTTLVEFELTEVAGGTRLRVIESGIDAIPVSRRMQVFRLNTEGWDEQMGNIEAYLAA
jgi:uncharacterized protein YndB with AHSA1/START domain